MVLGIMRLLRVLEELKKDKELVEIEEEVEAEDITYISRELDEGPALLFSNVKGRRMPILTNLCNKRERLMKLMHVRSEEELYEKLLRASESPRKGEYVDLTSASFTWRKREGSLSDIPVFKYYPRDAGPYITSGIVVAKSPRKGIQNASIHRMLLLDEDKLAIRIVPRHLWRIYREAMEEGHDLPVAILIGVHPAILVAAASSPPYGIDEMLVANALLEGGLKFVKLPESGISVPTDVEILIEGRITKEESYEGPFVDLLDIYDIRRKQPVIVVDRVWISKNAIYHAIVPASTEHKLLMGLYREALIWDNVRNVVPKVHKVRLTRGSGGWLHAFISIEKSSEGDGKNAIMAAFAAHPSLKAVVVVDGDVDVDDLDQVEWAIATRFQPSRDLVLIKCARGSSLDPSADQDNLLTDKIGIDATRTFLKPASIFERVKISPSERGLMIVRRLKEGHVSE